MAIGETKLSEQVKLTLRGYTILRNGRNRHAGGVLLVCKNEMAFHQWDVKTQPLEAIGLRLGNGVSVFCVYLPHDISLNIVDLNTIFNTYTTV